MFTYEYLQSVSQSANQSVMVSSFKFYQVLNAVSDSVFKRKCLMEK